MKINMIEIKKYISTHDISFLSELNRTIDIIKSGKSIYFKMYRINSFLIDNFIKNLDADKIYMVNPFITINCKYEDPILNLSRPFLITNNSNPKLIHDYLFTQYEKAYNDFEMNMEQYYHLIFNYKSIELDKRI
jgi:hypothetical protein